MYGIDNKKKTIDNLTLLFKEHKAVKYIALAAGGLAVLYLLGKSFSIVAECVRSYKDLSSAMKL